MLLIVGVTLLRIKKNINISYTLFELQQNRTLAVAKALPKV